MTDWTQWPFSEYSDECRGTGIGCEDCYCPCHGPAAPNFETNEEVWEWHMGECDNECVVTADTLSPFAKHRLGCPVWTYLGVKN